MQRLAKELTALSNDLPVNRSSSVFVRADEDQLECWQMLITGQPGPTFSMEPDRAMCMQGVSTRVTLQHTGNFS